MAIYRCNNCGNSFVVDQKHMPLRSPGCPYCHSTWTSLEGAGLHSYTPVPYSPPQYPLYHPRCGMHW